MFGRSISEMLVWHIKSFFNANDDVISHLINVDELAQKRLRTVLSRFSKNPKIDTAVSWQYSLYLYFSSRELYLSGGDVEVCAALFQLNKALSGMDLFYEIDMPDYFLICHTVGAVFAKAEYSDYCVFHQGVTVGRKGSSRPKLAECVVMYPGSMIIGNCIVGRNTVLAPGVRLVDTDTPGDCYVFQSAAGRVEFKELNDVHVERFFC